MGDPCRLVVIIHKEGWHDEFMDFKMQEYIRREEAMVSIGPQVCATWAVSGREAISTEFRSLLGNF